MGLHFFALSALVVAGYSLLFDGGHRHELRVEFGQRHSRSHDNDFGRSAQGGSLVRLGYPAFGGGGPRLTRVNDFRGVTHHSCEGAH